MDVEANMKEQEELVAILRKPTTTANQVRLSRARLKVLRVALVDWIKGGGFHPQWARYPKARHYFDGYLGRELRP